MKLKRLLAGVCLFSLSMGMLVHPAMAMSENHVNKQVVLLKGKAPTASNSSTLYLKTDDYPGEGDIQFKIKLIGPAKWLYDEGGTHSLTTGLTLYASSETELVVTAASDYMTSHESIAVPLFVKATGYGYISAEVDAGSTVLSSGTYQFASCGSGSVYVEMGERKTVSGDTIIKGISIRDTGALPIDEGTKILLSLNNGYTFRQSALKVSYSGKFTSENTKFIIDQDDPSKATIEVQSLTPNKTGAVTIENLFIMKGDKTSNGPVELTLKNGNDERTCTVAIYNPESSDAVREADVISFTIGRKEFKKGDETFAIDAAPYINSENYTMVPLRAAAEAFGIEDIEWNSDTKAISMTNEEGKKISLTIGSKEITVGKEKITADTAAQITDGRTFLPLRALANVLGVPAENISYFSKSKTVNIIKE